MKPRIGVYLSEQMVARLAAAAKRPGATKSALVEAALDRFLGSDDEIDETATVARRLTALSRQLDHLDRDLRIVNETVALHTRFQLATTPPMSTLALRSACTLGSERFEEFARQVGRRIHLGTPLMQETIDSLSATGPAFSGHEQGDVEPSIAASAGHEPNLRERSEVEDVSERTAAVQEDGSSGGFPERTRGRFH